MPAFYTHYLIAEHAMQHLDEKQKTLIQPFLPLYFFGAQGADFCFFYQFYNLKTPNFGSFLHRKGAFNSFSVLRLFSMTSTPIKAYALGYITHYASDCVFHPFVYSIAGKSPVFHNRLEYALDAYLKTHYPQNPLYEKFLKPTLKEQYKKELFYAYAAIAAKCGFPSLVYSNFSRSISMFNSYLPVPNALFKRKNNALVKTAANEEKAPWSPPSTPNEMHCESAKELFSLALLKSNYLMDEFLFSVKNKTPLAHSLFSKSFLTGI